MTIGLTGANISFVIAEHPSGKKVPAMIIQSGDLQVTWPFEPEQAEHIAQSLVQGIMGSAGAAQQANGGLIIPQMGIDLSKLNGSQDG